MEVASGYYLNLFDPNGGRDVFVIFNEANSQPTGEELDTLAELIERELEKDPSGETLQDAIEDSGLECVECGVQIRAEGLRARPLDQQIQQAAGKTQPQKASQPHTLSR